MQFCLENIRPWHLNLYNFVQLIMDEDNVDSDHRPHVYGGVEGASLRPFGVHWLDSALEETLLPGTPWEQIEEKVSRGLVSKLRNSDEFKDMEKKQMILQLLGAKFVEKHLRDEPYVPNILEPPRITLLKRQQLQRSMQKFLKDKLDDIARFHDFLPANQKGLDTRQDVDQPVEMRINQEHMATIFQRGLNRHVAKNGYTADRLGNENHQGANSSNVNAWSGTSNLLGHSLCAILQRDPHRLPYICKRLLGKQLPASLREFLWSEVLLRKVDSTVHAEKTSEKSLRKSFAKLVSKGKLEMKMKKATECPINGLISKAVKEKYESTVCMLQYKDTMYTTHCIEALNVLYAYNRSYEPYLVHWLFPIQIAFQDIADDKQDHPYELAFYLNLLQSNTFPGWPEVYAIAEQAMFRIKTADYELYEHLQTCSTSNVKFDPKEFMVQLLDDERKQAASLSWATTSHTLTGNPDAESSKALLAHPVVFLRKWIGEGFVSVLDTQAVLYVWDQFFISDWNRQVLEDLCVGLVLLLRKDFMEGADYHQMKQVFLMKPSKLYTADIQAAFQHIQSGKPLQDVPLLDRRGLLGGTPNIPTDLSTASQGWTLRPVGLKEIVVKLTINQPDIRKAEDEEFKELDIYDKLLNFQPDKLSVNVSLCHDGKRIEEKVFSSDGIMKGSSLLGRQNLLDEDRYTKTYLISFSTEPVEFKDIKIEASESSLRDNPPAVFVSVMYKFSGEPSTLGWCSLPAYKYQTDESGSGMAPVMVSSDKLTAPLYSGEPPENIPYASVQPEYKIDDYLQQGSCVTSICHDPSKGGLRDLTTTTPPPEEPLWVLHDGDMAERSPPWKPEQGFDLYVDQIRCLPDIATIVKVTGRVINPHNPEEADLMATALIDSPTRCPCFEYRITTESTKKTALAVFRVYTVDKVTKELVVLGSAIVPLYDGDKSQLNVGGFQLPIHIGNPSTDAKPNEEALDKLDVVPGVSMLIRILPITKIFIPAPDYGSGYYQNSHQSKPKDSHIKVMEEYKQKEDWEETVKDTIEYLYKDEDGDAGNMPKDEQALVEWMIDRLDEKTRLPEGKTTPKDIDITRLLDYDINYGMRVQVHMSPGVKGSGLYTQAVCELLPGRQAVDMSVTPEGYGVVDRFHTKHHKYNSLQTSPQWKDAPVKIHPHYDTSSVILIRLFGLTLMYVPDPEEEGPGVIKGKHGKKMVKLGAESYLGWTLMPLFDKGSVVQGTYILPLFQEEKEQEMDFLKEASKADSLLKWLKGKVQNEEIKIHRQYATIVVSLFDGHFPKSEAVKLPKRDHLLDVDDYQKFAEAAGLSKAGPKMCQHVLRALPKEIQDEEMNSDRYKQEEKYFEQLALILFDEILENVKEIGKD